MLVTNQHLDKLAAARVNFQAHGMLGRQRLGPLEMLPPDLPIPNARDEDNKDNNDGGAVDGDVDSEVISAQCPSEYQMISSFSND